MVVKRGDMFYADLSPVVGSEQGGIRPVIIIQNDVGNMHSPTVIAAAITSQRGKNKLPTHIEIDSKDFICMPDNTVDVKISMNFILNMYQKNTVNIVSNINVEENSGNNNSSSLVIYFVKEGDTLWKIAKKFKSTMEEIATVNNIEDVDKLNIGEQLYIPKYACTKIS